MRLSLGQRIFLAFSLLIVLILGIAVGVTYYRGNTIANTAASDALKNIQTVQEAFESQGFFQLGLISELFASDPYFASYVAEASGNELGFGDTVDTGSILDLLVERQEDLGFDIAMVLDDYGQLIASTEENIEEGQDFSSEPLFAVAIEDLESSTGYWLNEGQSYQIAVVPLADQQDLVGFLVAGLVVNDGYAESIKQISGSELVLLRNLNQGLQAVANTLSASELDVLIGYESMLSDALGEDAGPLEINLNGRQWLASVFPAGGADTGGVFVALTSKEEAQKGFRELQNLLLIVTLVSVILAIPVSLGISRRVLAPVRKLSDAAQSAARGDYQQSFDTKGGTDEVANLTSAFDSLLSDLREKNDMQGYLSDLAKYVPSSMDGDAGLKTRPGGYREISQYGEFSLLGVDLRRFAKSAHEMTAEAAINLFNANINNISSLASSYSGKTISVSGHRVTTLFDGPDSHKRALIVANNVLNNLMSEGEGVAAAIVRGKAVYGNAELKDENFHNVIGNAVFQLDRLLQESLSGQIFVTPNMKSALAEEYPELDFLTSQGVVSKRNFYALKQPDTSHFGIVGVEQTLHGTMVTTGGKRATARKMHIAPGMSLGDRYEILSELGKGAMGVVYKAHDHELNDMVALKMLKLSGHQGDTEFLEAMKSEIRLARKITHPTVLRTYDYGELEGVPYISMEYVRGLTLKYLLSQRGKIPYFAGLRIAKQLAQALHAAHSQDVLHRDVKPENMILEQNGNAKLMDFGIARQVINPKKGELEGVVGTPRYAAPEQLLGEKVDERADIYSAGIVYYHMFTGNLPFSARNFNELVRMKDELSADAPSTHWPEMPAELERIIMRCIARQPYDRYESAEALLTDLEKLRA